MTRPIVAIILACSGLAGAATAQTPAERVPITLAVEHLHNTGSCKGELTIDKWLFTYRSSDRPADDRDWKLTELRSAESKKPDELVFRTRESGVKTLGLDKNYKFRVPGGLDRALFAYITERID
jgi:hypothetical protein